MLNKCKSIGCSTLTPDNDFCHECIQPQLNLTGESQEDTRNTGGNVNYYVVPIQQPKRLDPYTAECEDIIEALGMNFAEGCAFKAIWRRCAARTLGSAKRAYDGGTYDAEKVLYYAGRMVAQDKRNAE